MRPRPQPLKKHICPRQDVLAHGCFLPLGPRSHTSWYPILIPHHLSSMCTLRKPVHTGISSFLPPRFTSRHPSASYQPVTSSRQPVLLPMDHLLPLGARALPGSPQRLQRPGPGQGHQEPADGGVDQGHEGGGRGGGSQGAWGGGGSRKGRARAGGGSPGPRAQPEPAPPPSVTEPA